MAYGRDRRLFNRLSRFRAGLVFLGLLTVTAPVPAAAAEVRVLALGDSLTAGYGLPPADGFVPQLQAALRQAGINATVLNAGVSGDTTAGGLARLDWALADKPDVAVVELGANDMLRGLDPAAAARNLDQILTRLQAAGIRPLLCGMKSIRNWGDAYEQQFDAIYPDLARRHQVPLYPFFLDGVALDPGLNQGDMLHPNAKGVTVLVAHILPAVEALIGGVPK